MTSCVVMFAFTFMKKQSLL